MHASTFGGSPLVSAASLEVFKLIRERDLLDSVRNKAIYLTGKLLRLKKKFPCIKVVRGIGLMVGIELDRDAYPIFLECLEKGLIINSTHGNVLRIMPSLTVSKDDLSKGINILEEVLSRIKDK